ncbi:MAG: threonylcarbamoyl-AMP synthase [Clostridia bacterium]|nr:threonylcarbamoyl-AMP synthase [Clostridia bacterium]
MVTQFLKVEKGKYENLEKAAAIINRGGLVAFPTETVYGLGADGLNETAVKKIYVAKGRPADNPLILHISDKKDLLSLVTEITPVAQKLMEKFWPGPMTLVLKKQKVVSDTVSGGLDTVAVRLPENEIARKLISLAKTPIAAPSANSSGRPSPTRAKHVLEDLDGKIDMILDGGSCDVGLESTVIDVTGLEAVILRPGGVTYDDIKELGIKVSYDKHLIDKSAVEKPKSPGMKYKHYAPKGNLVVLEGEYEKIKDYIKKFPDAGVLTFDEYPIGNKIEFSLGSINKSVQGSKLLFDILRKFDSLDVKTMFAVRPKEDGIGFALCNRLFKAAGGQILEV